MQSYNRNYNLTSLENDFKSDIINDYGYSLDYRKKTNTDDIKCHKTCCNHKKRVNKKVNRKK